MRQRILSISLIVVAGLVTYLCVAWAGFLAIDDVGMTTTVSTGTFTAKSLFLSGAWGYYRPLVMVSFLANAALWGLRPGAFHLVNLSLHLANALLVYWLALAVFAERDDREWGALVSSLFFLLTPLNSEAVIWISARTDLLCTFFFLLATILLVQRREDVSPGTLCCVAVAYLASLCAKEASIAFLGIAPLFLLFSARDGKRRDAVLLTAAVVAATALYALLRSGMRLSLDGGVIRVLSGVLPKGVVTDHATARAVAALGKGASAAAVQALEYHPSVVDGLGAYGFYLRKLVFPWPLCFTILDYQRASAFAALCLAPVAAWWLLRRHRCTLLPLLIVLVGIVPAILAYLGNIAWTPLGERYLYLPMTGFALLLPPVLAELKKVPRIVPVACLLLLALPTMARVSLWCDDAALWRDSLRQSPSFAKSYSALGVIAYEEGKYDEAERALKRAVQLGQNDADVWRNLGEVYAAKKDYPRFEAAMLEAAARSRQPTGIYLDLIMRLATVKTEHPEALLPTFIKYHLLALSKDPTYLEGYYNAGKLYLAMHDLANARTYLRLYLQHAKAGMFRPYASRLLDKIDAGEVS